MSCTAESICIPTKRIGRSMIRTTACSSGGAEELAAHRLASAPGSRASVSRTTRCRLSDHGYSPRLVNSRPSSSTAEAATRHDAGWPFGDGDSGRRPRGAMCKQRWPYGARPPRCSAGPRNSAATAKVRGSMPMKIAWRTPIAARLAVIETLVTVIRPCAQAIDDQHVGRENISSAPPRQSLEARRLQG